MDYFCPFINANCRNDCVFRFAEYCLIVSMTLDTGTIATALDNKYKQPHFKKMKDSEK